MFTVQETLSFALSNPITVLAGFLRLASLSATHLYSLLTFQQDPVVYRWNRDLQHLSSPTCVLSWSKTMVLLTINLGILYYERNPLP